MGSFGGYQNSTTDRGNTAPRVQTVEKQWLRTEAKDSPPWQALLADVDHPDWMQDAACLGYDPDAWFPSKVRNVNERRALWVCRARCPVRNECLAYALSLGPGCQGIWGGTTHEQRRHFHQKRAGA